METVKKKFHMSIDIEGVLGWPSKDLLNLFGKHKRELYQLRKSLEQKLRDGHEVLPINDNPCEGFDKVKGCPGHAIDSKELNNRKA